MLVALDEVTDPQNLGAVVRTAECAGATGVVIPERRSAEVTPAVVQGVGGRGRAPARSPACATSPTSSPRPRTAGCWCYGAAAGARTPYREPDYSGGVVLVLGAEGKGLRPRVASACDDLISLPHAGTHRVAQCERDRGGRAVPDLAVPA